MDIKENKAFCYRFFARALDYSLTYLFGTSISLFFLYAPEFYFNLLFPLMIPLLWAPIEALSISLTGTTPGKMFFGLSIVGEEGKNLSLGASLKRSFFIGSLGTIIRSTLGLGRKIFGGLMILFCVLSGIFTIAMKNFEDVNDPFGRLPGWVNYADSDERFTIDFPKNPEYQSKQIEVPRAGEPINYEEYVVEVKNASYSVSYVDFPKKWRLLGSNKLLKKSLDLLVAHDTEPGQLMSKSLTLHGNHPALDFVLKKAEQEVHGRLVLVGTTLYKLAVGYPDEMHEKAVHLHFLDSFNPK